MLSRVPTLPFSSTSRYQITTTHPPTALQSSPTSPCTVCISSTTCFFATRPTSTAAACRHNRTPSRPTRCFALSAFLPRPPVCRTPTHTRKPTRARSSPFILIASSARAYTSTRPTPHLSATHPPQLDLARQRHFFTRPATLNQDTQASTRTLSIDQEAIDHTAGTTSVYLVAPH